MTADVSTTPLATGFDQASLDQWRALVDKALKGGDFEKKLVAKTADGLRIPPLYTSADARPEAPPPGSAPFTRGTAEAVDGFGWRILSLIEDGDPHAANRAMLAELEGGANGILLQVEAPGQSGVRVASAADVATLLTGVELDYASLEIDAGLNAPIVARHVLDGLSVVSGTHGTRQVAINLDPLGCLARFGLAGGEIAGALSEAVKLACEIRAAEPSAKTVLVNAVLYHEAGASEAQEIGLLASTLTAYLRAFETGGVTPSQVLAQINVRLAADTDIFATATKFRAARTVVARIAEACGAPEAAAHVRFTAATSARMMTQRDPWTNMLRTTAATAAAAIGGVDALLVLPFTHALGAADAFARRIARNTQIIAQEESHLGRVRDPAGGSWYVEQLTHDFAGKGWALFQDIEGKGGLAAALTSGWVHDQIGAVATERAKAIATGRSELTGVSAFPKLGPDGVTVTPRRAAATVAHGGRVLAPIRLAHAFEQLRDAADGFASPPAAFLASLGEIADHTARSTWIRNTLASGGIAAAANDGYPSAEAAAAAFKASGLKVAVIASSDALYGAHAVATARALKAVGATHVALAGRPGALEAELKAAGVDRFIFAGQDVIATLKELQAVIGA